MAQPKGSTGNPNGRPKGVQNKVTLEMKVWVQQLIDQNRKLLKADLKKLKPEQRWQIVEKLMGFCIPKMQNVDANLNLEKLSDQQLDMIILKIINTSKNEHED